MSGIPDVNKRLFNIAKKLSPDDVDAIKFLYTGVIGERKLEDAKDGIALLKLLKENNILNTIETIEKFCDDILVEIGRDDIRDNILGKESSNGGLSKVTSDFSKLQNGHDRNKKANRRRKSNLPRELLEIVANKIAGDWRKFARKLEHDEGVIEQVDLDFRKTYDKTYEILTRWLEQSDIEITWVELKVKLEGMPRYDIVREIEEKFPDVVSNESSESGQVVDLPLSSSPTPPSTPTSTEPKQTATSSQTVLRVSEQSSTDSFTGPPNYAIPGGNMKQDDMDHRPGPEENETENEEMLAGKMKNL